MSEVDSDIFLFYTTIKICLVSALYRAACWSIVDIVEGVETPQGSSEVWVGEVKYEAVSPFPAD